MSDGGLRHGGLGRSRAGRHHVGVQTAGSVRRPDQWTAHHPEEAERARLGLELDELIGMHPALDRVMARGRAEVLRDGEQVAREVAQVAHRRADFFAGLAHAENEVGLGDETSGVTLCEHIERALVAERRANPLEDARHRFQVVREDLGLRVEHLLQQLRLRGEVWDKDLYARVGVERFDLADRLGVKPRALVVEVITRDARDGCVTQPHRLHALRNSSRLVAVERRGLAGVDLAEVTTSRALLAADEERRLAVLPALEDVGAARLFADRVQAFPLHQRLQLGVFRPGAQSRLDPRRLLLDRHRCIADLEPQHATTIGRDTHDVTTLRVRTRDSSRSTTGSTSATVICRPASRLRVVTPASVIPQGTMPANDVRSQSQLSANPCIATPRATRIPIAATLRCPSAVHTPLRPSTRTVGTSYADATAISASSSRRT